MYQQKNSEFCNHEIETLFASSKYASFHFTKGLSRNRKPTKTQPTEHSTVLYSHGRIDDFSRLKNDCYCWRSHYTLLSWHWVKLHLWDVVMKARLVPLLSYYPVCTNWRPQLLYFFFFFFSKLQANSLVCSTWLLIVYSIVTVMVRNSGNVLISITFRPMQRKYALQSARVKSNNSFFLTRSVEYNRFQFFTEHLNVSSRKGSRWMVTSSSPDRKSVV